MKPLRVALVTRRFWPLVGGAEMVMANLAAAMRRLGAETEIVTAQWERDWPREVVHREVPVHRIPQPRRRGWGTFRYMAGLSRWLRHHRDNYDAICVSMLKHSAYVAVRQALRDGTPVLLRAEGGGDTGDCHWQQSARFGGRIRRHCQRAMVVAPSQQIYNELIAADYPSEQTHYVPNGVDIPPTLEDRNAARLALADANRDLLALDDAPVATYTGRLTRKKGLFDLVRAWAKVVEQRPEARLWLVGEGEDREPLYQLVKDLDLQGRVLLPGAFDTVDEVLQAADLFVLPSHEEGMSLSLLEAMAAGRPVVASDIPGNQALIDHNVHGLLTPPRDVNALGATLLQMLGDAERDRFGRAAHQRVVDHYSLDRCAKRHLELLAEQLQSERRSPRDSNSELAANGSQLPPGEERS